MSYRMLDIASGQNGGAICLLQDPKRARNIHVTILNPTNATHAVYFGRSRRELTTPGSIGIAGFAIMAVANTVVNQTIGTVAYTSYILLGWVGELWAACDSASSVQIDAFESAGVER